MKLNKKQFGLAKLLTGLALLAASHGVYWKQTTVSWHQARISAPASIDSSSDLYCCTIEKRNFVGR